MNRVLISFVLFSLVGALGGCGNATEHRHPAGVDPKKLTYADPELRTLVVQMDEAIRGVQPDWAEVPFLKEERKKSKYSRHTSKDSFKAEWHSHAPVKNGKGQLVAPNHRISVEIWTANPPEESDRIGYASFQGKFLPETGWGGALFIRDVRLPAGVLFDSPVRVPQGQWKVLGFAAPQHSRPNHDHRRAGPPHTRKV